MPRRFVRPRPPPVRSGRQASSKRTGRVHCHCHRGFAIIAPSIRSAAGPIAPTIAGSNISSTIAPSNRLAAAASALAIAIGGVSCAAIRDAASLAAPAQNPKDPQSLCHGLMRPAIGAPRFTLQRGDCFEHCRCENRPSISTGGRGRLTFCRAPRGERWSRFGETVYRT